MSNEHDDNHGNSPAAWAAVIIMLVAFAAGTTFFWLDMPVLVIASAFLLLAGAITGIVLARVGYGVGGDKLAKKSNG